MAPAATMMMTMMMIAAIVVDTALELRVFNFPKPFGADYKSSAMLR
jgi:hypothetical protein